MINDLKSWRENISELYDNHFSEEEQEVLYEIIRGNVPVEALNETLDDFFIDSDTPSHPEFDTTTDEGIINRLEFDIGYVGGYGTRAGYRTN